LGCAPAPGNQLIRDFDDGMSSGRTHVFARFHSLIGKSLPFRKTHALDGRLVPISTQVTGHCDRSNLFAEKSQPQGMYDTALIASSHGIQAVLAEDVQVWHCVRIERVVRQREFNDEPP